MKKAINMAVQIQPGAAGEQPEAISAALQKAFEQANPGLKLSVKQIAPAAGEDGLTARVYIEGEQEPAADFSAVAAKALQNSGQLLTKDAKPEGAPLTLNNIHELDADDDSVDNDSLVLSPQAALAEAKPATQPDAKQEAVATVQADKTAAITTADQHDHARETAIPVQPEKAEESAAVVQPDKAPEITAAVDPAQSSATQAAAVEQPASAPPAQAETAATPAPASQAQAATTPAPSIEAATPTNAPTVTTNPAAHAASNAPTKVSRNKRKKHRK